jgi:hypothetical protein
MPIQLESGIHSQTIFPFAYLLTPRSPPHHHHHGQNVLRPDKVCFVQSGFGGVKFEFRHCFLALKLMGGAP